VVRIQVDLLAFAFVCYIILIEASLSDVCKKKTLFTKPVPVIVKEVTREMCV